MSAGGPSWHGGTEPHRRDAANAAHLSPGQPLDAGSAAYEERTATGIRGREVELSCRMAAPAVVFWSFTAMGSAGPPRAVAVGSGPEVVVAPGAGALGRVTLRNGTLELRELRTAAAGRFLCQGLFPEWGRLRVGYAAVMLRVLGKVSLLPVLCTAPLANSPRCWLLPDHEEPHWAVKCPTSQHNSALGNIATHWPTPLPSHQPHSSSLATSCLPPLANLVSR